MNRKFVEKKLEEMLMEDALFEDITSRILENKDSKAEIICKENCVIAGVEILKVLFEMLDLSYEFNFEDGDLVKNKEVVARLEGSSKNILLCERTALNILSRLSGVATLAKEFLSKAREVNPRIKIAGTRKTTPLFGFFEKEALRVVGCDTHRYGLYDSFLIKDNHLKFFSDVKEAIEKAKSLSSFVHKIEVEVESLEDAILAAKSGADIIMLDNFSPEEIKKVVKKLEELGLREKVILEASGNISLDTVKEFASSGVDVLSIGMLTHSYKSIDFSLEIRR